MKQYFKNISQTTITLLKGLQITFQHLLKARHARKPVGVADKDYFQQTEGIVTLQYPYETLPVPNTGRYKLHNEIDDCIVCDKCAKICPVNCIDIVSIRATEEIGKTSDGTSKRLYAAKFDIDMSKCCFCGLCTVVCPTECLTMTKEYDFSVFDVKAHNFEFSDMTPASIDEKKKAFAVYVAKKPRNKKKPKVAIGVSRKPKMSGFKPKMKSPSMEQKAESKLQTVVFSPKIRPKKKD